MKHLVILAAGLGHQTLADHGAEKMAGLAFKRAASDFPAVTCTAQATFRTASAPREHGMTANGLFLRNLRKPFFWEQSAALVGGPRIWDAARAKGEKVGLYFWQQSLGESVDTLVSPAPIHKHGGGLVMQNYTQPAGMSEVLDKLCGTFPLHRYWGPFASAKVGRSVCDSFLGMHTAHETDYAFVYLPTLDYEAQRHGPQSRAAARALREFRRQLERLAAFAARQGADFTVVGDYAITPVTQGPVYPNRTLRQAGLFAVRPVKGRTYPDFNLSQAFALCDHEIAHVYLRGHDAQTCEKIAALLRRTGDYETVSCRSDQSWAHENAGEILLVAKKGAWCAYPWWNDPREAPDYATRVDIHSKPGYDPCELFFGGWLPPKTSLDASRVKGSHGRPGTIAWASTAAHVGGETFCALAASIFG